MTSNDKTPSPFPPAFKQALDAACEAAQTHGADSKQTHAADAAVLLAAPDWYLTALHQDAAAEGIELTKEPDAHTATGSPIYGLHTLAQWIKTTKTTPNSHTVQAMERVTGIKLQDMLPPAPPAIPPEFSAAMHRYKAIAELHGDDSRQARGAFVKAMRLAPDWFADEAEQMARDMGLIPSQPDGYTSEGVPVYRLESVAASIGISVGEAWERMQELAEDTGTDYTPPAGVIHTVQ